MCYSIKNPYLVAFISTTKMYQNDKGQCNEINNLLCHHSNIPQGRIFGLERPIPSLNNLLAVSYMLNFKKTNSEIKVVMER